MPTSYLTCYAIKRDLVELTERLRSDQISGRSPNTQGKSAMAHIFHESELQNP